MPLETRNRFAPLQNTQDEVLDKEAKNYKEKETLQHRHQTPVYSKQNRRPNVTGYKLFGSPHIGEFLFPVVKQFLGKGND